MDVKQHILGVVSDLMADFLYYDRKEDEDLPRGAVQAAIKSGEITIGNILTVVEKELMESLK